MGMLRDRGTGIWSRSPSAARGAGLLALACGVAVVAVDASAHPLGMYIYRNAADKLVMVFPWENHWPIKYRIPPFEGYLDGDYPYEEAMGDRPSSGLFRTHAGAKLEVVLVEMSPGFYVRDPFDINIAMHDAGERFVIGETCCGFLTFPWWHLDTSDPEFNPNAESWEASFYLHDITGIHSDSDVYTFHVFANEGYCPADLTTTAVPGAPGYGVPDQVLNNDDFFYYIAAFAEQNWIVADVTTTALPGSPGYGLPDGLINNDDFFYYLSLYALGC
jgi:hypothetical protein